MSERTLPGALEAAAKGTAGFTFMEESGEERGCSFAELRRQALGVAGALTRLGLAPADRVVLIVPEPERFMTGFLGVSLGGFVPVPLVPPIQLGQLDGYLANARGIIQASGAVLILTTLRVRPILGTLLTEAPALRHVLAMEELEGAPLEAPAPVSLDGLAFLQFTSGSTSRPKGVAVTHRNLAANILALGGPSGINLRPEDVGVSWLPLYHDMGLIGMALTPIYFQVRAFIMPPLLFLKSPVQWLRVFGRHRGSVSFAPNFAYGLCTQRIKPAQRQGLDLSSWRVAGCGAEPIRAETLRGFAQAFAHAGFREQAFLPCYGMAEHTLAVTFPPTGRGLRTDTVLAPALSERGRAEPCEPGAPHALPLVSCGSAFPGHEVRILGPDEQPLGERQVGEIALRGPSVMRGYDGQEELTREALRGGWLHSGDLGYLLDGELYVCGRLKELIILGGRNYYPQDLEWAAAEVEGVRRGNVIAFGTSTFGERERVVVVVETKAEPSGPLAEQVRQLIQTRMGLQVDEVLLVPAGTLPKTSSGKLQRALARKRYEEGTLLQPRPASKWRLVGHLLASRWAYLRAALGRRARRPAPGAPASPRPPQT